MIKVLAWTLVASVAIANGAVFREIHKSLPDEEFSKCFSKTYNIFIELEKTYPVPNYCGEMLCTTNKQGYEINYYSCGKVFIPPVCQSVEDLNLPYPDCCPRAKCLKFENVNIYLVYAIILKLIALNVLYR